MESKEQINKSEQISPNLNIEMAYDQPLTSPDDVSNLYSKVLELPINIEVYGKRSIYYSCEHDGLKEVFFTAAITSLSKPHPLFKKRIQLKSWWQEVYSKIKDKKNVRCHLIGIYHYDGLNVFVDFNIKDYENRSWNNSSAHIYTNDIYQGISSGYFEKIDQNKNIIKVISNRKFKNYIFGSIKNNSIFDLFKKFNEGFSFGKWITAVQAISEMKEKNFFAWRETEWAGWLLEYRMQSFIESEHCEDKIRYIGNIKSKDLLDFDLYFSEEHFYGDLKASDITKLETPANKQENVLEALNKNGKLWYVIYEHETIKDSMKNNEMALKRMELINHPDLGSNKISYATRMKHSVNFKCMKILELNRINMNQILRTFNQGHQMSGDSRTPKFNIDKKNIDNYLVFTYSI